MTYPAEELERLRSLSALYYPTEYEPRPVFSPSGLSKWERCARAGGYRYLLGIKKREVPWATAESLLEPTWKGKPHPDDLAARKLYNSLVRPALGVEGHARMQGYYQGHDVEWNDRIGSIMLPGLGCIPYPDDCDTVEAEGEIEIEYCGIKFRGFRDLLVRHQTDYGAGDEAGSRWLLVDHKTTYTFDFIDREKTIKSVKTPAQLTADIQSNLYAFAVMQDHDLESLDCRWVYYRTEGDAAALPVDFTIEWVEAEEKMRELAAQAAALEGHYFKAGHMRIGGKVHLPTVRSYVEELPANTGACEDFGGCEYAAERGGPCTAVARPSEIARRAREKERVRAAMPPAEKPRASAIVKAARRANVMGFRDNLKNKQAAGATQAGTEAPAQDEAHVTPDGEAEVKQAQAEAVAPPNETPAEPPSAAAASTPKRTSRAASKAAAPAGGLAQLAADLAAKEAAAVEAQAEFDAAKAAMREALS